MGNEHAAYWIVLLIQNYFNQQILQELTEHKFSKKISESEEKSC
jgi:hypothetical protein